MLTLLSDSSDNVVYLDIDEYHAMAGLSPASGGKAWSDFFTACCNLQDNHLFVIDDNPANTPAFTRPNSYDTVVKTFGI